VGRFSILKARAILFAAAMLVALASLANASATLLLEEPYGKLGFFTATGHAAVYLSNVCADSPNLLRACRPGETGVVISRYEGMGYDWLAVPLIPYLYAVEKPEDVPLFADTKMVAFLRDQYRRQHLEEIAPDAANGEAPSGHWNQLVGSAYDRNLYGFTIETTSEQDAALIRKLNSSPNRSHFHLLTNNCADFAKSIINFYYPKALHRSLIADVGITTPKQLAKRMVKFDARNPDLESSRFVVAQVPGSMARSTPAHGVVESFFTSKKYIVPAAVFSPIFAGSVFAVYVGTGAGTFQPDKNAMVLNPDGEADQPLSRADRKQYQSRLKDFLKESGSSTPDEDLVKEWGKLESKSKWSIDDDGSPVFETAFEGRLVRVGTTSENILGLDTPPQLIRQLLEARLQSELRHSPRNGISRAAIAHDWLMLQQAQRATAESQFGTGLVSSHTASSASLANAP
jgi:hypothetical protein